MIVPQPGLVISRESRTIVTGTAIFVGRDDPVQSDLARDASYVKTFRNDSVVDLMTAVALFFRL